MSVLSLSDMVRGLVPSMVRCKSCDMVRGLVPFHCQMYVDATSSMKKGWLYEDTSSMKKDELCVDRTSRMKKG